MRYWLFKSEPKCFSIDDLAAIPGQTTMWDGVRNYQARNFIRDEIKLNDTVFFYNSVTNTGIAGFMKVASKPYPDPTQWDPDNMHFDPASKPEDPRWYTVDVNFIRKFPQLITLKQLRSIPELGDMELLRKGSRLSIQPVSKEAFDIIMGLTRQKTQSKVAATQVSLL